MSVGRQLAPTASPVVARFGRALLTRLDALTDTLVAAILSEDPSYAGGGSTPREDLHQSCRENLHRILQALTGETEAGADPLDAPRATGRRRAEQGMPLESVLHAYRVGFRVVWEGLVAQAREADDGLEPLVDAASEVWELVDVFSSAVSESYRDTQIEHARRGDRRREALVDALLDGRGADRALAADAAAALDLPEHGRYVVAVVAGEEAHQGLADALRADGLRAAWRTRTDRDIALVALGRAEPAVLLAALGSVGGARAGVSPVVDGLAQIDTAYRLADTALRALPPATSGVAELDARLPAALLVTAPDLAERLVARALGGVLAVDHEDAKVLLDTLRTWLDEGGSAGQTAARLYCHRNTVLNRLRRVEGLTGRSLERVDHLVEWSLALLALDVLPPAPARPVGSTR